jgi:PAS domain S-box-containing protein
VRTISDDVEQTGRSTGPTGVASCQDGNVAVGGGAPIKANILIVDDKPENLFALAQMLGSLNENIAQAKSGADALRYLLRQDAAIILVDVRMPDMDGYELAALIRRRERSRDTPIIFITAFDKDDRAISRGYMLGAVDYVFKPIDPIILRAKVSVFVDLFKKTETVRRQADLERRLHEETLRAVQAERTLRQIEEIQSFIVKSLPIALYRSDPNGRFAGPRFLSESIAASVGFKAAAFIDDQDLWPTRIHPADLPQVLARVASIVKTGTLSMEYRWRCDDGSERIFLDQAVLIRHESGEPKEILGTCLDVTYRRQLEQQLVQSQKMEAIGQLTGGIAHDFNNMLTVIIWNLDPLTRSLNGQGKDHDRAQNALSAALNCAELTRQLLAFAHHQPRQAKVIDLSELLLRMARLLGAIIGEGVRIEVRTAQGLWPIFADPTQVESAVLNLAINARDAMPKGGSLIIEAVNVRRENVELGPVTRDYVMMAVTDAGIGMSQEVIDRAFEPFFTTKPAGEGTGLGLSTVYGFVRQSGGDIKIESAEGIGTTIRLYLPRGEAPQTIGQHSTSDGDAAVGEISRIILVVEDNADVRSITVKRLEELHHRVLAADNAATALEILSGDSPIDLLFTDVIMPGGMNGFELARRAVELRSGIKVIIVSGYASSFDTTGGAVGERLQKPYGDEELRRAVARALGDTVAPEDAGIKAVSSSATLSTGGPADRPPMILYRRDVANSSIATSRATR